MSSRKRRSPPRAASIRRQWLGLTEELTRQWVPGDTREASRVFTKLLTPTQQMGLAQEIVETRAAELVRAYDNLIDVAFGYRRHQRGSAGSPRIVRTPCVRFLVKRKWQTEAEEEPGQKLPKRLFAYCWVGGERRLCAVPTDVEDARVFAGTRPHMGSIDIHWHETVGHGAITCALRRSSTDPAPFALSCRHVLSLSDIYHPQPTWGARVRLSGESAVIGHTRAIAGRLSEAPQRSFDAQFLKVTDMDVLKRTLAGFTLAGYAGGLDDVPNRYYICTPRQVIPAQKLAVVFDRSLYYLGHVGFVAHRMLIESVPSPGTRHGDSGSPVVSQRDGGILLGMHVAGVDKGPGQCFAYMIPAWQLFDPSNYDGVSNEEMWSIVNP